MDENRCLHKAEYIVSWVGKLHICRKQDARAIRGIGSVIGASVDVRPIVTDDPCYGPNDFPGTEDASVLNRRAWLAALLQSVRDAERERCAEIAKSVGSTTQITPDRLKLRTKIINAIRQDDWTADADTKAGRLTIPHQGLSVSAARYSS